MESQTRETTSTQSAIRPFSINIPELEFESVEQAKRWYDSDAYASLKNLRLQTTNSQAVLIQGI